MSEHPDTAFSDGNHLITCDYEGCPNPAHAFWTVESVYCKEHLEQWRKARERFEAYDQKDAEGRVAS